MPIFMCGYALFLQAQSHIVIEQVKYCHVYTTLLKLTGLFSGKVNHILNVYDSDSSG